ncbi:MAG TPA: hypothetical protein VFT22_16560 [Kofleriaceae bacterium]|nr:hypothetical protein [Kofleriaceae bacterium]
MRHQASFISIDPATLSLVGGGAGSPDIKGQCGTPPPGGNSSGWNFHASVPLSKIPYVGKYLPDLNVGGNGQKTSDYKTCVDAVTGKK